MTRILIAAILAFSANELFAQATLWTNFSNSGNSWTNSANWTNGVPTASMFANINRNPPASYTVNHDFGTNEALRVVIGSTGQLTATLDVQAGTLLNIAWTNGGGNSPGLLLNNRAVMNVYGTVLSTCGVHMAGNSTLNIDGGLYQGLRGSSQTRIGNTGGTQTVNVINGGQIINQGSFTVGVNDTRDQGRLNVLDGYARFESFAIGNRGTGVVIIGAAGTVSNVGPLSLANQPYTGNAVGDATLVSTGSFFNSGDILIGQNISNALSDARIIVAGGTFLQLGNSSRTVVVGDRMRGSLTVEGGAFLSTNNMIVGRTDTLGLSRGDGTVLVTGTGAMAVTNAAGTASITLGTTSAVADADRAIGRLTVASGSLDADVVRVQNGVFTNSGGTSTIGNLLATTNTAAIALTGGTLNLGASTINNGQALVLGDGIGAATLNLTGNGSHSFADGLLLAANSLLAGAGTINGSLTNFGTIAPGIIAVNGDAVLADTSLLLMELAGTGATDFDQFNVTGLLGFDGTLTVTLTNGFTPQVGDIFDLFDFGATNGLAFDTVNLPDLVGAVWDTTDLYVGGSIAVVIPEPGTFALLGIGALLLLAAARHRRSFPK